ncbi:MAG TPA: MgtC/SapB family protein [Ramlibacter sp.]|uniref:MgtC/SapB family protein n=1 Tax=Ramlibacter sp. TaxID=1917967 RepID=UPI002D7F590C|nr:MgtC/SapB family protein [Ramlibacter sp.]HET8745213.1 MgtC/SapB family protein [Ramlibacter sp.]
MAQEYFEITFRLIAALFAGGLIGLERSHRGRPAGFRTHALVCLASSLLMLVTVYESHWFSVSLEGGSRATIDPTRLAQGIMTGIGFVGAGAIIKEGFSVRGLTTAASIWITAAIGILTGIGFYLAAAIGTLLALGTLSLFRWVEARVPTESYATFMVRFKRGAAVTEEDLRKLLRAHGFAVYSMSYRLHGEVEVLEYRTVIRTMQPTNLARLSHTLNGDARVLEYRIAPASE